MSTNRVKQVKPPIITSLFLGGHTSLGTLGDSALVDRE